MYKKVTFIKEAMKKDLIFISDPFSIVLLRATEPKYWNEYRNKTAQEIV